MDNNGNINNNINFDPMTGEPINKQVQQPIQNQSVTNMYSQSPIQNVSNNTNVNHNKKNNKPKILLFLIGIIVISLLGFISYKFLFNKNNNDKEFNINKTTAFFLQNLDSKYALFNEDGKQLTDFLYTNFGSFFNGTARVEIDGQEGIINSNGKYTVPLGKYKYIIKYGGLYSVNEIKEGSYNRYLINGNGKILYDLKDIDVKNFIDADTFLILEFEKENKYRVINYQGKELVSFPKVEGDDVKEPTTNDLNGYISIFYNNKNWIFNAKTGKQISSFDSNLHYCVNNVSEDEKIITLNSCVSWFQSQEKTYYKFIKDGKLYDKSNECDKISENQGNLFCTKNSKEYLLDDKLNLGISTYGKAYSSNSYVADSTTDNYAVDFYQNGKKVNSVTCRDLDEKGYMKDGIYLLGTHFNSYCQTDYGNYEYYNSEGKKIIEKTFKRAEPFDSNGLAKVSDDKRTYYMIDKTGKQIGNIYSNISLYAKFYIITNNNLKGIMDKEGKEIIPTSYSRVDISTHKERTFASLKTIDNKYIVYDLDKNKELFTTDSSPNMSYEHYITTSSNGKTQYYTFDGKLFYEK